MADHQQIPQIISRPVYRKVPCLFERNDDNELLTDHLNPVIENHFSDHTQVRATVKHHGCNTHLGLLPDHLPVPDHLRAQHRKWARRDRLPDWKSAKMKALTKELGRKPLVTDIIGDGESLPMRDDWQDYYKAAPNDWIPMKEPDLHNGHWLGWYPLHPTKKGNEQWYYHEELGAFRPSKKEGEEWDVHLLIPSTTQQKGYELVWKPLSEIESHTYEFCGPKLHSNPYGLERHVFVKHGDFVIDLNSHGVELTYESLKNFMATKKWEGIVWHTPHGLVKVHCGHLDLDDHWNKVQKEQQASFA